MAATVGNGKDREEAVVHPNPRQGGKLLSRLLTRDSSAAAPSFRVYYGVASAGAVPFLWESQPGTPKNAVSDTTMPPLTPPPSYYAAGAGAAKKHAARKAAAGSNRFRPSRILGSILMATRRRGRTTPSGSPTSSFSSASTSSSSSSYSASSFRRTTQSPMRAGGSSSSRLHSSSSSFSDEEETAMATCFRVRHESFRALKGCRVAVTVRSALASVGGAAAHQAQRV
ncbi:hypothetical protein CFC21_040051 [Triticum aestivum]|uniref:Uncharacterized protein n=3 Tax=Triticum TaxID=4564 RepID=A0A9R1FGP0_WHEAT|nr:uncharacterized protein LOC119280898 [Triticum dicoccoides]XP_044344251.1 uncharacterized protein LOC123064924 [Triticum aestivum]KAF7028080.1 hypothetical protein CFC21_040051 [Triticum aestivum]CDM81447.1 unnamed protein product [Triticum aestivum]VAH73106.1 unnamed protein product [Triticum turgidum subsp. durum]